MILLQSDLQNAPFCSLFIWTSTLSLIIQFNNYWNPKDVELELCGSKI